VRALVHVLQEEDLDFVLRERGLLHRLSLSLSLSLGSATLADHPRVSWAMRPSSGNARRQRNSDETVRRDAAGTLVATTR
jgi:hypothetical protein